MVSKTLVCLVLLAVVAICSCKPFEGTMTMKVEKQRRNFQQDQPQKNDCLNTNSDSSNDSNESNQQPCELINQKQHKNKKNLQIQDSSSSESQEEEKKMKVLLSQEDNNKSKEIRHAPEHQPMNQGRNGPDYMRGQQQRENIQKSRKGNGDSNDNSQGYLNQIDRRH